MRISTKGRYAVRMMADIAQHDGRDPVRLRDISARQEISMKYLEQIAALLVRAELLKGVRGQQGGYHLTRKPEEYVIGDILRAAEGSLSCVECLSTEQNNCRRAESCAAVKLWRELDQAVSSVVDRCTLEDLIKQGTECGTTCN